MTEMTEFNLRSQLFLFLRYELRRDRKETRTVELRSRRRFKRDSVDSKRPLFRVVGLYSTVRTRVLGGYRKNETNFGFKERYDTL